MSLKKLRVEIDADSSGFQKGLKQVEGGIGKLKGGLSSLVKGGLALAGVTVGLKAIGDSMKAYVGLESSVSRVNSLFGDASKYVQYFAENTAKGFGMAESAAYQYAAVYGNLFKGFTRDSAENAKVTINMLQKSAVVASKTGRTMEDVMERIRSGLLGNTESIEDLGINVNVAMLEVTDAFKKIANGRSWEKLNFYEQQQVRTLAILEQAHKNYGDEVQQGSAFSLSVLSGAFKDLQATAGAFISKALAPVVSWLTQVVQWATAGLKAIAAMLGINVKGNASAAASSMTSGAVGAEDMASGLGESAKNAKKLQSQLAGFDQFNDITKTADAGAGGVGGASASAGAGASVFDGLQGLEYGEMAAPDTAWVDSLKSKLDEFKGSNFFQGISQSLSEAVSKIKPELDTLKTTFGQVWIDIQTLTQPFLDWLNGDFLTFTQTGITTAGEIFSGLLDSFNTVFSDIWSIAVYPMLEKWTTVLLPMWTQVATEMVKTTGTLFTEVKKIFDMLWKEGVRPALELIMKIWIDFADLLVEKWNKFGKPIFEGIRQAFRVTGELLKTVWDTVLKPVWNTFMETVDWLWDKHLKPLLDNFLDFVGELILCATKIYNEFIAPLVKSFVEKFGPPIAGAIQYVISVIGTIIGVVADIAGGIIKTLKGIIQFITGIFTGDWGRAWEGVKNIFGGIWDGIAGVFKGVINIIIDGINVLIRGINRLKIDIPDWVPGGAKTLGFNIPQIPKLANGGIAYGEITALVGDNFNARQNPEVIAPFDKLEGMMHRSMLSALLQNNIAGGGNGKIELVFKLDNGTELIHALVDPMNKTAKNMGYAPVFKPANA